MPFETVSRVPSETVFEQALRRKKIMDIVASKSPSKEDHEWLKTVCLELKRRVSLLTPNNRRMQEEWATEFDVDLFMQMLKNDALEDHDAQEVVRIMFRRLKLYCAPVQDEAVAHVETTILEETDMSRKIAILVEVSSSIMADIERLTTDVAANLV